MFDYRERIQRLYAEMETAGLDAIFLGRSSDLEYLTGFRREVPNFGNVSYAHGWVGGAFFRPPADPVFILPRMMVEIDLERTAIPGEVVVVRESDDGREIFNRTLRTGQPVHALGIGSRLWGSTVIGLCEALGTPTLVDAEPLVNRLRRIKSDDELDVMRRACGVAETAQREAAKRVHQGVTIRDLVEEIEHQMRINGSLTPSFTTHIWTMGLADSRDSHDASAGLPIRAGEAVLFDFGAVVEGYCSDFGRTVFCGEPGSVQVRAYEAMLAAQRGGFDALRPGVRCCDANAACRQPIEDAGMGVYFRHRMGHGIGLDVHERPFMSVEEEATLQPGMTFTVEPSIIWHGRAGCRIEDIAVVTRSGAEYLNNYPSELTVAG